MNKNVMLKVNHYLEELKTSKIKRQILSNKINRFIVNLIKYIFMIGISFVILYPLFLQISVAFRLPTDINNPQVLWIPDRFSIQNFRIAVTALNYHKAFWTSLFNSVLTSILTVFSTSFVGYSLARLKYRGRNLWFFLCLFSIIVPQTMVSLPMYINFARANLIGKPYVLFLMAALGMGIKSGIFIYLFRQSFKGLPKELEEAAYMDGCNIFKVYFKVMFPCVKSTILTVFLLAFVWQWNDYYYTNLFFIGGASDVVTLATQLQTMTTGSSLQFALMQANIWQLMGQDVTSNPLFVSMILNTAGIIVMLPVLIMYFFLQKLFVEGIESSGIVG